MAPAASKLTAEADLGAFPRRALAQYLRLLRLYPVLTKATTRSARSGGGRDGPGRGAARSSDGPVTQPRGILSALGNFLAQLIEKNQEKENCSQKLDVRGPLRYAIYGFFFTGPLGHSFHLFVGTGFPPEAPSAGVARLLPGRLLFAPAFLSSFFLIVNSLEMTIRINLKSS
ncbi:peroxisomal membrane protein 2 isoform X3 [Neophocaena asiaeorientalis asiaeorientalis]|uniref:Peroxisomal membrane protein 2 isoform X3 n=1 Tax=Neophocaena asiaeorientalis asiaeorientalis TaxID=1706337 RepID=A0A341B238_NEOAA|nr:peroxisomal membrane protein 2 isoform X3 [Neophocaena asiaeorientalis asiaeorientalis]